MTFIIVLLMIGAPSSFNDDMMLPSYYRHTPAR